MKITTISVATLTILAGTVSAFAQNQNPIFGLLGTAKGVVAQAIPLLMGLAMVAFFYGLVLFIWKGREGGEDLAKAKSFMIYSIVGLFVMVSIWGIVAFMQDSTGIDRDARIKAPPIPGITQ